MACCEIVHQVRHGLNNVCLMINLGRQERGSAGAYRLDLLCHPRDVDGPVGDVRRYDTFGRAFSEYQKLSATAKRFARWNTSIL